MLVTKLTFLDLVLEQCNTMKNRINPFRNQVIDKILEANKIFNEFKKQEELLEILVKGWMKALITSKSVIETELDNLKQSK